MNDSIPTKRFQGQTIAQTITSLGPCNTTCILFDLLASVFQTQDSLVLRPKFNTYTTTKTSKYRENLLCTDFTN